MKSMSLQRSAKCKFFCKRFCESCLYVCPAVVSAFRVLVSFSPFIGFIHRIHRGGMDGSAVGDCHRVRRGLHTVHHQLILFCHQAYTVLPSSLLYGRWKKGAFFVFAVSVVRLLG